MASISLTANVVFFLLLQIVLITRGQSVNSQLGCSNSGLHKLRSMKDIKRIKAAFVVNSTLAYYRVQFCPAKERNIPKWICFATTIDKTGSGTEDVVRVSQWSKLVDAITGANILAPYNRQSHEQIYGSPTEYFPCKTYYIIEGPINGSNSGSANAVLRGKTRLTRSCFQGRNCTRTCLHSTETSRLCHEIRLQCAFKSCRGDKKERKQRRQKLRKERKKKQVKSKFNGLHISII